MNDEKIDYSVIKGPIIIFVLTLLIGGGFIWGSLYFKNQMMAEYNKNKAMQRSVSNAYVAIDEEKLLVRDYLPSFLDLYKQGVLGQQKRLSWIETLQSTRDGLKFPSLRYEIDAQKPYDPEFPVNTGSFSLYASSMNLKLEMIHEIDLIRFLERLNNEAMGIYRIDSCEISRLPTPVDTSELRAHVSADCYLNWFNIKKSDGRDIEI